MQPLRAIQLAAVMLALAPAWAGAQLQSARFAGQLLSTDGSPVVGAELTVAGTLLASRSDSSGRFILEVIPARPVRVQARAVGYSPLDTTLTLQAGETLTLTLRMSRTVQQLAPVVTEAVLPYGKPLRYQHTGKFDDFYERRAKRPGTFFTREDIESSGRNNAMELMSTVPGVTLNFRQDGHAIVRIARCEGNSIWNQKRLPEERYRWLIIFIDGRRVSGGAIGVETLDQLKSNEIETMEVYRGPSQLPIEAIGDACAAVFITTRYTTGSVLPQK